MILDGQQPPELQLEGLLKPKKPATSYWMQRLSKERPDIAGEQPSIRGDHRPMKLQHQAPVEIEAKSIGFRFTRWVRHASPARSKISG